MKQLLLALCAVATLPALAGNPPKAVLPVVASAAHRVDVRLAGGRVATGPETLTLRQGEQAEIHVSSDKPVALHLHGYELHAEAGPARDGVMKFDARLPGRFPVHEHREGAGNHRAVFFVEVRP